MIDSLIGKENKLVSIYKVGGVPLTLVVAGVLLILEALYNVIPDEKILPMVEMLAGAAFVLAGAACWAFSVHTVRLREFECLQVIETIVTAAARSGTSDNFLEKVGSFLQRINFSTPSSLASTRPGKPDLQNGDAK